MDEQHLKWALLAVDQKAIQSTAEAHIKAQWLAKLASDLDRAAAKQLRDDPGDDNA